MSPCIEWERARMSTGYGAKWHNGKLWLAHRLVLLELHVPIAGMLVRHHCDNRGCVNPDHLTVGTHWDNVNDMVERGRGASFKRTLSAEQVRAIRMDTRTQTAIAAEYGVAQPTISKIKRGIQRKDVA